jgi:hypothetical protein
MGKPSELMTKGRWSGVALSDGGLVALRGNAMNHTEKVLAEMLGVSILIGIVVVLLSLAH